MPVDLFELSFFILVEDLDNDFTLLVCFVFDNVAAILIVNDVVVKLNFAESDSLLFCLLGQYLLLPLFRQFIKLFLFLGIHWLFRPFLKVGSSNADHKLI